jgi:hypothetical protein
MKIFIASILASMAKELKLLQCKLNEQEKKVRDQLIWIMIEGDFMRRDEYKKEMHLL